MSVLVYTEHAAGQFRKSSFEAISYASAAAGGDNVIAVVFGNVTPDQLGELGKYGASEVVHIKGDEWEKFSSTRTTWALCEVAASKSSKLIIIPSTFTGKGFAPRVAARLKAGYVDGVVSLPDTSAGFKVTKNAFSGKAFADVSISSEIKILGMVPNSYKLVEKPSGAAIAEFTPSGDAPTVTEQVHETIRATDKISLPEAELVVSAGRGMKGPENWGMIEELAGELGAATACSKPVSDADWRPHSEHVGQTGISISPNLYIAIGISGAIQHLAGVSASKTIVVINKDPEAPFFKAADYGIVGDAFEVVPRLIESVRKYKGA
jgi:electron transfer flavoprotein alpha subunit